MNTKQGQTIYGDYAHPETLVSADWVAEHLNDPKVRIIESNEDVLLYDTGHIHGAVHVDWLGDCPGIVRASQIKSGTGEK